MTRRLGARLVDRRLAGQLGNAVFSALAREVPPIRPPESLRGRVVGSAAAAPFAPFISRLGHLFDLRAEAVERVLSGLGGDGAWQPLSDGVELVHVAGGKATARADVGLVRLAPGATFPRHTHLGPERVLVLQGVLEEPDGRRFGPGSLIDAAGGTEHHVRSVGVEPLVWAVVVFGVKIEGIELPPD